MTQFIQNIFVGIFGDHVVLATILIAMVPIIELKGAIPFAMATKIWGELALSKTSAFLWAFLGSSLVVPILLLIYKPLIKWLKKTKIFKKIATKIEEKVNSKKENLESKFTEKDVENENLNLDINEKKEIREDKRNFEGQDNKVKKINKAKKLLGVFAFVAIPLPFTGVWTGSCLAVALGLDFFSSCICVIAGNLIAGLLITFFSSIFDSPLTFLLIFLGLIVVFALVYLLKKVFKNKNSNK